MTGGPRCAADRRLPVRTVSQERAHPVLNRRRTEPTTENDMQRIALVSEHASPLAAAGGVDSGGQNVYVAEVARELSRRGVAVDVYTRRDNPLLPAVVTVRPGMRVVHVDAGPPQHLPKEELLPYMPAFAAVLDQAFAAASPSYECVHANFFMSGWASLQAVRRSGLPLVTTFHALGRVRRLHQGDCDGFPDARFAMEEELVRSSHRIVAECPQDRGDLLELYAGDPDRIDVVPCGYDAREFHAIERSAARRALGWPGDAFIVLQLGRLVPRKGIDTVIEAVGLLKRNHGTAARLYVVGGSSERPNAIATPEIGRLMRCAAEAGVDADVHFVGRRDRADLHRYFSAADVFVTTPWYEPFGITPVEAMACGAPVVGSAVGGIRTTVVDGVTGLLVPPKDPAALADRLARLAANPALRRAMGEAGRQRANALYTWSRVTDQLIDVYRHAIADARDERFVPSLEASDAVLSTVAEHEALDRGYVFLNEARRSGRKQRRSVDIAA